MCRPPMPTYIAIYNPIHPHQRHLHHRYSIHLFQHSGPVSVGQHQLQYLRMGQHQPSAPQTLNRHVPNFVLVVKKVVLTAGTRPHASQRLTRGTVHCTNYRTTTTSESLSVDTKLSILHLHRYLQMPLTLYTYSTYVCKHY